MNSRKPSGSRRQRSCSDDNKEITAMYWYDHDVNGWGYALMTIGMLGFWTVVITGVVLMVRQFGRIDGSLTASRTPE
ncbi:MAG: hypothetical protein H0V07_13625, partial [Propionibacteriales bacterium]|nr:hypothetical protein [Propionibacteriales bacterium]